VLIEHHGLARNGGTLINRINSIAESNPIYGESLRRGQELLRQAGYPGF
jgi:filamentous hemagglutinin